MKKVTNLNWPGRLALLNAYSPSDAVACKVLGISNDELKTARDLEQVGTLVADSNLDTSGYNSLFTASVGIINPKERPSLESVVRDSSKKQPPMSATKKVATPKKRGRKGDRIARAFAAIPTTPIDVDTFRGSLDDTVSTAVLRQSKRFDNSGVSGSVRVKKDKTSGNLMIWREAGE
jgi:hypothetical protein